MTDPTGDGGVIGSRPRSPGRAAWERFARHRPALVSAAYLAVFLSVVLVWPWIAPFGYEEISDAQFEPPSARHWCGTDVHGRDLMTRVFYGARVSMLVGVVGAGVALVIGVSWGAIAGYAGGRVDGAMMRTVDVLYSMPSIIFVIVLITTLNEIVREWLTGWAGPAGGSWSRMIFLIAGLGAVSWLTMARIIRGQVLTLRQRAFIQASQALGASHGRILARHILPNLYGIVIVYTALTIPSVILYESFLSYLGLGIQPPMASWGTLLAEGSEQLNAIRVYWWLLVIPGGFLAATLLALNFVSDGLREALDR